MKINVLSLLICFLASAPSFAAKMKADTKPATASAKAESAGDRLQSLAATLCPSNTADDVANSFLIDTLAFYKSVYDAFIYPDASAPTTVAKLLAGPKSWTPYCDRFVELSTNNLAVGGNATCSKISPELLKAILEDNKHQLDWLIKFAFYDLYHSAPRTKSLIGPQVVGLLDKTFSTKKPTIEEQRSDYVNYMSREINAVVRSETELLSTKYPMLRPPQITVEVQNERLFAPLETLEVAWQKQPRNYLYIQTPRTTSRRQIRVALNIPLETRPRVVGCAIAQCYFNSTQCGLLKLSPLTLPPDFLYRSAALETKDNLIIYTFRDKVDALLAGIHDCTDRHKVPRPIGQKGPALMKEHPLFTGCFLGDEASQYGVSFGSLRAEAAGNAYLNFFRQHVIGKPPLAENGFELWVTLLHKAYVSHGVDPCSPDKNLH